MSHTPPSSPSPSLAAEDPSLSPADCDALVALLEQCPAVVDKHLRDRIVVRLHERALIDIPHANRLRGHVDNIVTFCNDYAAGLAALIEALRHFDPHHITTERVADFLAARGIVAPDPAGPGVDSNTRGPCPYPGMVPLTERALFFGRDPDIDRLVHHVRDHALTLLVGPSGVGKSSLIQAGLLPRLPRHWPVRHVRLGATPLASLWQALGLEPAPGTDDDGDSDADSDTDDIIAATVAALLERPDDNVDGDNGYGDDGGGGIGDARLVIVVDPLEELFQAAAALTAADNADPEGHPNQAGSSDSDTGPDVGPDAGSGTGPDSGPGVVPVDQRQIEACYRLLTALAAHPRCHPVLVLRADFYGDFMHCPLWPLSEHSRIELGPLSGLQLRDAITKPAASRGVVVESDLVERLLADAARQPGTLPLLQETLRELWHKLGPADDRLQLRHYRAVGAPARSGDDGSGDGGSSQGRFDSPLEALLARKADAALAALVPQLRPLALPLLLRLIQFGHGRADTRRRQPLTNLGDLGPRADVDAVVRHLAQRRLLTVTGEGPDCSAPAGDDAAGADLVHTADSAAPGDGRSVDLAHEAIIRSWPVLRRALADHRGAEQTRRRLEAKAGDYQRHRRRGGLLDAIALGELETWLASDQARYLGVSSALRALAQDSRKALDRARRRRRAAIMAMAALTLLTAMAAAIAWYQRGRALDVIRDSRQLATTIVSETDRQLEPIAGTAEARRSLLAVAEHLIERLREAEPDNMSAKNERAAGLSQQGDLAMSHGDLTQARDYYQRALALTQQVVAVEPDNVRWQHDLSVSYKKLGEVAVASGNLDKARSWFRQSLDIDKKLAAAGPNNADWQRALSVSYVRLGYVEKTSGNLHEARSWFRQSFEIFKKLVAADPNNVGWQRDLAVSYEKLGAVAVASGNRDEAHFWFRQSWDIRKKLAAADPNNVAWQHDLAVSYSNLGDLEKTSGNLDEARSWYQQFLDIRKKLAAADPNNAAWQRDLAFSYNRLGDVAGVSGNLDEARSWYRQSLDIIKKLAVADPDNAGWQRDLIASEMQLAVVAGEAQQPVLARIHIQAAKAVLARLDAAELLRGDALLAQYRQGIIAFERQLVP